MRLLAGLIGSLTIALSAPLLAQPIPPASIADKEMGWIKVYNFPPATEPLKVDTRVYSAAQRTIAVDLANWMQASYNPIGGLGDVVRTFPKLSGAVPQSYGVVGRIYDSLKYGANGKIEPYTGDSYSWNVMVNGTFGRTAEAISTPEHYYFTIPSPVQHGFTEEIAKTVDLSGHPFLGRLPAWLANFGTNGTRKFVLLSKDGRLPFVKLTRGEYLDAVGLAITRTYESDKKKLSEAEQGDQKQIARWIGPIEERYAKRREVLEANRAKYKNRLQETAEISTVVPDIKLSDDLTTAPKTYQIKIHGTMVTSGELRIGDVLVIIGDGPKPSVPGDDTREPAFGMKAVWVPEMFTNMVRREGFTPVDNISVLLTHLGEVIRNNLAQLLSYKDMRTLIERLDPEYRRLIDEMIPAHLTYSGLQAVLKLLLAERISIRNLHLILEAIAEVAPHVRRVEQLTEHVRMRLAQQICGDLLDEGTLKVLRLGNRWDLAFHQALKRDSKGDVAEFDIDPRLIEQFSTDATKAIRGLMDEGHNFVLVTAPDARPYVRMVIERLFATLPVLSHLEVARGVSIKSLGAVS